MWNILIFLYFGILLIMLFSIKLCNFLTFLF